MKTLVSCFYYSCLLVLVGFWSQCYLWTPERLCPEIIDFSPYGALSGTIVTVKGDNFCTDSPDLHEIFIGDTQVPDENIIEVPDGQTIRFKVPKGAGNGQISIEVKTESECSRAVSQRVFAYYYQVKEPMVFAGVPGVPSDTYLFGPKGMDVDKEGNVWVADCEHQLIQQISVSGKIVHIAGKINSSGWAEGPYNGKDAEFANPSDVAVDSAGRVYVADEGNNMIRRIDAGANHPVYNVSGMPKAWETSPIALARYNAPTGIAVDDSGIVYVVEYAAHRLRKLDFPADHILTIAGDSTAGDPPRLFAPTGVDCFPATTPPGYGIYVADQSNNTVRTFDVIDTHHINDVKVSAPYSYPRDLCLGSKGTLFITDQGNKRVLIVYPDGTHSSIESYPFVATSGIALDEKRNFLYVSDYVLHIIVRFPLE